MHGCLLTGTTIYKEKPPIVSKKTVDVLSFKKFKKKKKQKQIIYLDKYCEKINKLYTWIPRKH